MGRCVAKFEFVQHVCSDCAQHVAAAQDSNWSSVAVRHGRDNGKLVQVADKYAENSDVVLPVADCGLA